MRGRASSRRSQQKPPREESGSLPPDILELELATLVDEPPLGQDWLHEIKLDGYRIVATVEDSEVRLYTRRANDWTARAPNVAATLAALPVQSAVLDGEIVSLLKNGVSSFQALQNALSDGRAGALVYFVFDLLYLDGEDLRPRPLLERKQRLNELLKRAKKSENLRLSEHVTGEGLKVFEQACKLGLEGTIAKRAHAAYRPGRGKDWLKIKCIARQEFVIGGYTPPAGSRQHLGALLVGVREQGVLRYAGKVGTGFSARSLADLHRRLKPLERSTCPFTPSPKGSGLRGAHWVAPQLVAEIAFTEFTHDGRLRHPSFQGLREDKPAGAVVRERPKKAPQRGAPKRD